MENVIVQIPGGTYNVSFGPQVWAQIENMAKTYNHVFVVTDRNVERLYGDRLPFPHFILPPGEEVKNIKTILILIEDWVKSGFDRESLVIALGGGVVGDLAGFAASIYQRGIHYLQVPTTLLAQVDSSVGGKTGVNLSQGKNLIGTFHHPQGVFVDPFVLQTLAPQEITNGLGEVFKYGIIADSQLFELVHGQLKAFYKLDIEIIAPIIRRCCEIKSEIVSADEKDYGLRKILNYGHTLGHALETVTNYKIYSHGEAVLLGMVLEARLAKVLGVLTPSAYEEIVEALQEIQLNWVLPNVTRKEFIQALLYDKKNRSGQISFILPKRVGSVMEVLLSPQELEHHWERVMKL